jgi:hypothetical protein
LTFWGSSGEGVGGGGKACAFPYAYTTKVDDEMKNRLNYGNGCCQSVQKSGDSSVSIVIGIFVFFFATASRLTLGPTQPIVQWVPGAFLGVKDLVPEADPLHPSMSGLRMC